MMRPGQRRVTRALNGGAHYLCRAWIDAVLDDAARAFTGALFAAWACDDSGLEAAAAELRTQAATRGWSEDELREPAQMWATRMRPASNSHQAITSLPPG
jgi:hypothetical protein